VALHRNVHQGSYGEAFVHALACAAGFTVGRQHLDVDGVDWQIGSVGPLGSLRSPRIEVQVKSWSQAKATSQHWNHRILVSHFNMLAGPGFMVPRFLMVVVAPISPDQYVQIAPDAMILSHAAYWLSLADRDALPTDETGTRTTSVQVPMRNLVTVDTLTALVRGDVEGASS
jgi:hypothetical protein